MTENTIEGNTEIHANEIKFLTSFYLCCFIISIIIFISYGSYAFIVYQKIKAKPEKVTIITISMYGISMSIRLANWSIYMTHQVADYIHKVELLVIIASQIVWIILYYFTFELKSFKDKIESQNAQDFFNKQKKNKILKIVGLIIIVCAQSISFGLSFYYYIFSIRDFRIDEFPAILNLISNCVKGLLDLYMILLFTSLILFFVYKRREKLKSQGQSFTKFNYFMIGWVFFLISCNTILNYIFIMIQILLFTKVDDDRLFVIMEEITEYALCPVCDFFTAMTLLYLFKVQAQVCAKPQSQPEGYGPQSMNTTNLKQLMVNKSHSPIPHSVPLTPTKKKQSNGSDIVTILTSNVVSSSINNEENEELAKQYQLVEGSQQALIGGNSSRLGGDSEKSIGEDSQLSLFLMEQLAIYKRNIFF